MFQGSIIGYLVTFFVSLVPIVELRGAIPIGVIGYNITYIEAFILAVIGNCIPIYFIVKFIGPIFKLLGKIKIFKKIIDWATEKATNKIKEDERLQNYTSFALFLFVAIPLPGTGAWTGSLIANFLGLPPKKACPPLILGVLAAGIIILTGTAIANGGINYLLHN